MLKYIRFFIWLFSKRFTFFNYPLRRQASILERKKLYFEAGYIYTKLKNYNQALYCYQLAHAYKHIMYTYERLGLISEALHIAEKHKYHKEGACIAEKSGNTLKAAYFYAYFQPHYAAKLFKKEKSFYQAGLCYLQVFNFTYAIDCFYKCSNLLHQIHGFKQLEEIAVVLYFNKQYKQAFKLFIRLQDFYSALECAKKLKNETLISHTQDLLIHATSEHETYYAAQEFARTYYTSSDTVYQNVSEILEQLSA